MKTQTLSVYNVGKLPYFEVLFHIIEAVLDVVSVKIGQLIIHGDNEDLGPLFRKLYAILEYWSFGALQINLLENFANLGGRIIDYKKKIIMQ